MKSDDNIYSPPKSELVAEQSKKPGVLIILFAILFTLPLCIISFLRQYSAGMPEAIGGVIGSLIPALLVVLIFQIGKSFRNSRSRWKIYTWSQFVFLLGQVLQILKMAASIQN